MLTHQQYAEFYSWRDRYEKEESGERWITLNGGSGDDGHGGTPVKIDGEGNIVAGPKGLKDNGIEHVDHFADKDKQKGNKEKASKPAVEAKSNSAIKSPQDMTDDELSEANKKATQDGDAKLAKATWAEMSARSVAKQNPTAKADTALSRKNAIAEFDYIHPSSVSVGDIAKMTDDEIARHNAKQKKMNDAGRRKLVESAISAGKTIPPEVLADYPDLAAKHSKQPILKEDTGTGGKKVDSVQVGGEKDKEKDKLSHIGTVHKYAFQYYTSTHYKEHH